MHKEHYSSHTEQLEDVMAKLGQSRSCKAIRCLRRDLNKIMDKVLQKKSPISYNHAVNNMLDFLKDKADSGRSYKIEI